MRDTLAIVRLDQGVFVRDRNDRQRIKRVFAPHRGLQRRFIFIVAIVGDEQEAVGLHKTPDFLIRKVRRQPLVTRSPELKLNQLIPACFCQPFFNEDIEAEPVLINENRAFHFVPVLLTLRNEKLSDSIALVV